MAKIMRQMCYLMLNVLIMNVLGYVVDSSSPLCGTIDGLPANEHRIYFKDIDHGIRTVELNGKIVGCYPSRLEDASSGSTFNPSIHKCNENYGTFCTNCDDYPMEHINHLFKKHGNMLSYAFSCDRLDEKIDNIIETETHMCETDNQVIYPTSGQTEDNKKLYIINTPEHKQGVMVSMCKKRGHSCRSPDKFPYQTECQQHYVYRELLALSPEGVPVKEYFKFPAYCSCALVNIYY